VVRGTNGRDVMALPQPAQLQLPAVLGLSAPPLDGVLLAGADASSPANAPSSGIGSDDEPYSSKSGAPSIGGASLAVCISGTGCSAVSVSLLLP